MIAEQEITDTLNIYANDYGPDDAYDDLACTMHEVRQHVATARTLIQAAMQETPGPLIGPIFETLAKASSHLFFALTAWEPDPGMILTKRDTCPECQGYGNLYTAAEEDGIATLIDCPSCFPNRSDLERLIVG